MAKHISLNIIYLSVLTHYCKHNSPNTPGFIIPFEEIYTETQKIYSDYLLKTSIILDSKISLSDYSIILDRKISLSDYKKMLLGVLMMLNINCFLNCEHKRHNLTAKEFDLSLEEENVGLVEIIIQYHASLLLWCLENGIFNTYLTKTFLEKITPTPKG